MKNVIATTATLLLLSLVTGSVFAQDQDYQKDDQQKEEVKQMMSDTTTQAMLIEQIVEDPETREKVVAELRKQTKQDIENMDEEERREKLQEKLSDEQTKEHARQHVQVLQALLDEDQQMSDRTDRQTTEGTGDQERTTDDQDQDWRGDDDSETGDQTETDQTETGNQTGTQTQTADRTGTQHITDGITDDELMSIHLVCLTSMNADTDDTESGDWRDDRGTERSGAVNEE